MRDKLIKIKRSRLKPEELYIIDLYNKIEPIVDENGDIEHIKDGIPLFKTSNTVNGVYLGVDYNFKENFKIKFRLVESHTTFNNVFNKHLKLNYTNFFDLWVKLK